jgi:palmitoyl-protein thioesterase
MRSSHPCILPFLLFILGSIFPNTQATKYTPVVLMHGFNADAGATGHMKDLIQQWLPGVYVRSLEIGNGPDDSIFMSMNEQVQLFCEAVAADPNLAGGMNVIGVSQGGLLSRGFIERCNNPPVKIFVSWLGPMMGIYGIPGTIGHIKYLNVTLDDIIDCCIYDRWVQDLLSFPGYWRDPFALSTYAKYCKYLPDINNEGPSPNPLYKQRITSLQHFLMFYSTADETLIPRETGWFGSYAPNSDTVVLPVEATHFYKEDWIGIRKLNETGRLHKFVIDCDHADQFSSCFDKYFTKDVIPFLLNSTIN